MAKRLAVALILLVALFARPLGPLATALVKADSSASPTLIHGLAPSSPSPEASAAAVATGWLNVNTSGFGTTNHAGIRGRADLNGQLRRGVGRASVRGDVECRRRWTTPDVLAVSGDSAGGGEEVLIPHPRPLLLTGQDRSREGSTKGEPIYADSQL